MPYAQKTKVPIDKTRLPTLIRVAAVFGKAIELRDGEARVVPIPDTPATVAAKMQAAHKHLWLWRRYQ